MKTKKLLFLIVVQIFYIGCTTGQTFNKEKADSLLFLLAEKNKAMGSLAIAENGEIIYSRAIGYSQIMPDKVASNEKTKYRIGSISKMFTATLIFQLIDEGRLNLSTTLDQYFPTVSNAEKITIGNMLSHRSGIHSFTNDSDYLVWMVEPKTRDEMIAIISSKKADFEPDARTAYSNSNYVLLGFILEEIFKKPYNAILQSRICVKAGLKDTYYGGKTDITKNESYSFRLMTSWEKQPETDMSIPHGAGAVVSTSADLVKFIHALFAGQLVSIGSLTEMKTMTDGMGMGMQQFPYENKEVYGHGGAIDGFNSMLCYFPDEKIAIAYCSNGTVYSVNDIVLGALAIYYQKPYALPVFTAYAVTSEELQLYPGVYSSEQIPIIITITTDNGKLFGQGAGQPAFPLEATAKDVFKFEQAGIVIKFTAEKGEFVLEQGGGSFTFKKNEN